MKKILLSLVLLSFLVNVSKGADIFLEVYDSHINWASVDWDALGDDDGMPDADDDIYIDYFTDDATSSVNITNISGTVNAVIIADFGNGDPTKQFRFANGATFTVNGDIDFGGVGLIVRATNPALVFNGNVLGADNVSWTFGGSNTTTYSGSSNQNVAIATYNDLVFSGTGKKVFPGSIAGLRIRSGGSFNPGTSTVLFNQSTSGQDLENVLDNNLNILPYYNVEISGGAKEFLLPDFQIGGGLILNTDLAFNHVDEQKISFVGSGSSSISGTESGIDFEKIEINKDNATDVITLNNAISIQSIGVLMLTRGVLSTNGNLTLLSTSSTASARLAEVDASNASVIGNVTVERYIPSNSLTGKFWWHIGSPLSGVAVSQLQDDFTVTGTFTGSNTITGSTNGQSMRTYDETNASTALEDGWVDFPASSNAETMTVGKGYRVFLRNTISTTVSDFKTDVTGTLMTGDFDFNLTYTSSGTPLTDGWNFVSNPYPSPIDWDNSDWTKTNIEPTAFVWDAKQKTYRQISSSNGDIPSFQGFWVQANSASPSLVVKETCKNSSTQAFSRTAQPENQLEIAVIDKNPNDLYNTAITYVNLNSGASEKKDQFDVNQLGRNFANETWEGATLLDIATKNTDNYVFRENFLPVTDEVTEVPLTITFNDGNDYGFEFHRKNFSENTTIILKDKYLDTEEEINEHSFIEFKVDGNLASKASDRFSLLISSKPLASVDAIVNNSEMKIFPNPTSSNYVEVSGVYSSTEASIIVSDINGVTYTELTAVPTNGQIVEKVNLEGLTSGVYLLSIKTDGEILTQKIIIE